MIFLMLFLGLFVFWIYAEFRLNRIARISAGVTCLGLIALATVFLASIIPHYESGFHRQSLRLCEQALTNGNPQLAIQALHTYNGIAATGSTYKAAMTMSDILVPLPKELEH